MALKEKNAFLLISCFSIFYVCLFRNSNNFSLSFAMEQNTIKLLVEQYFIKIKNAFYNFSVKY